MRNKRAISLIVLVITIIVMAILAATVIITLSNTNIIEQAQKAKDATNQASEKEALSVALTEWKIIERRKTKTFEEFMKEKFGEEKVSKTTEDEVTVAMESGNKYNVAKDGTITEAIETVSASKGAFVEYDVAYTDVYYSDYKYTTTNGWRLLDYTKNADGTYSNVKLISTGLPARLHYYHTDTTNNSWWVTDETKLAEFKNVLGSDYTYYTGTSTYYGLQAAAGMYYNFGDIKFAYGTGSRGYSLGYFTEITSNGTTYNSENTLETTGIELFIPTEVNASVRLLTLPEMDKMLGRTHTSTVTDPTGADGLFVLQNIQNITGMSSYTYNSGCYWLASPYANASSNGIVNNVHYLGGVNLYSGSSFGVRPVVILSSDVQLIDTNSDGVLEIVW